MSFSAVGRPGGYEFVWAGTLGGCEDDGQAPAVIRDANYLAASKLCWGNGVLPFEHFDDLTNGDLMPRDMGNVPIAVVKSVDGDGE